MNKDSAVIEYPGSPRAFGVDRNHKEMAKFSNDDAHALEPAIHFLAGFAREALAALHHHQFVTPLPSLPEPNRSDVEDKYSILDSYDTVFLVDDSPSMAGERGDLVKKILDYSTTVATSYDPNGIDVHFFNNRTANQDNVRDAALAVEIHQNIILRGSTPIRDQLSRHLNGYLRKFRGRHEDDLNFKGYNLIILTDGEPNPEPEDPEDISDHADARVTKGAYRMMRKMIVDVAQALDEEGAERGQVGIQFCQIGNDAGAHAFFNYLDNRLKGKWKLKRDVSEPATCLSPGGLTMSMVDTVSCESETDLTKKFFEKLLLGAIDKAIDHDKIPTAGTHGAEASGQGQLQHSSSMAHRPKDTTIKGITS